MTISKTQLKTCWEYDFYRCEFAAECSSNDKISNCASDYIKTINNVNLLKSDCRNEGYTIGGIEAWIKLLENSRFDVAGENQKVTSFAKLVNNKLILPLEDNFKFNKYHNLRASEFNQSCTISRIISKFKQEYISYFPKHFTSIVGDTAHTIFNTQPNDIYAHNDTLFGINRNKYCEKELSYEYQGITINGHADAILYFDNTLLIVDHKRSFAGAYQKPSHKKQLLIYALAILQEKDFENIITLTINSPFPRKQEGTNRIQKPMASIFRKDSDLIKILQNEIKTSYEEQVYLMKNQEKIISTYAKCKNCFNLFTCIDIKEKIQDGYDISYLLKEEVIL